MSSSSSLAVKAAESDLRKRIENLEIELRSAREQLARVTEGGDGNTEADDGKGAQHPTSFSRRQEVHNIPTRPPPQKRGYLFRWNDRSIGFGGTKWELRFIQLEHGRLSYYRLHTDSAPRYVLSLRGCGVHDDGWKRNRRHRSKQKEPPLDEPGAYFFVFSIYLRSDFENIEDSEVVPLLRFSTPCECVLDLAGRMLLSETCDYCETTDFLEYEASRVAEDALQQRQQVRMAAAMPEAKEGTLPPLFFAPSQVTPRLSRRPSFTSKISPEKSHRPLRPEVGDIDKRDERSKKAYPPSKPMHRSAQPSFLSAEAKAPNYRGLFNLGVVVLLKLLEQSGDLLKVFESPEPWQDFPVVYGWCMLSFFVLSSFVIEWMLSRKKIDETIGMILHQINTHSSLVATSVLVWTEVDNPLLGSTLLFVTLITWMKLVSYMRANEDYRLSPPEFASLSLVQNLDAEDEDLEYPQNVTLTNLLYFWCAPTLTYQLAFPKYPVRRWWQVASLVTRIIIVGSLVTFLTAQAIMPLLEGLVGELEATGGTYTIPILAKYWLKLSLASAYTWILGFYLYFHLVLNLLAELLRFGDRVFYKDWWNSCEASSFWRLWNMPVHYWLIRHVYFPCIRLKLGRTGATFVVFLLSAILHEVAVPLVGITKILNRRQPGSSIGNLVFWLSFCVVGQPIAVLLYAIDYEFQKETGDALANFPERCRIHFWGRCLLGEG
eukprot:scaffold3034_cov173-Amphora_coffeaeformis.AAC.4